jgi:hypothetical protein
MIASRLTNHDRLLFIQLLRWFPSILKVLTIIRPETLVRWDRAGFRGHWRWKSCPRGGRPQIGTERRRLVRRMRIENPLWEHHAFTENCSSLGLRSRRRASPRTWPNGEGRAARDGGPSCITTRRTLPPWTCSLFRPSVSTCSMLSSSSGSVAEILSGSMSEHIRPPIGSRDKSRRHSLARGSALHDPRPRSDLRCGRHAATARNGHPGQAYRTSFILAEWLC